MQDSLRDTIEPRSDQINYDDVAGVTKTITVSSVTRGSAEQPVTVHYDGENGRPYKPCKSMRRVLIWAWGEDGRQWAGRSMTLYGDPEVKFGGVKVGGIRISHLSHIDKPLDMPLTVTKGKRSSFVVQPLKQAQQQSAPPPNASTEPPADDREYQVKKLWTDTKRAESAVQLDALHNAASESGLRDWAKQHMPDALAKIDQLRDEKHKEFAAGPPDDWPDDVPADDQQQGEMVG